MKRLFLNNEEIFVNKYSTSIKTLKEDYELFLSVGIANAKDYTEACKLKNIEAGDVLQLSASNALVKIATNLKIKEIISYHLSPDDFLDEIARMCFKFKIEKETQETVTDLSDV